MIHPNSPEESGAPAGMPGHETHSSFLQIPPLKTKKFSPNSNYIRLDYQRQEKVGEIIMPGQAKGLDWITATVLAVGPECKLVKPGDRVLLASKGLVNGEKGVPIDGRITHWTQENMIVTVIVE